MEGSGHLPVLVEEVLEYLDCRPDRIYVDGTVGSGGHSRRILERSSPTGRLIGLDWDEEAIERARENLHLFEERVWLRKGNFKKLSSVLMSLSIPAVDGILLDLGVSTEQLESRERGFSFRWEAPLDMRMSQETETTAQDLVGGLSPSDLEALLREYGDERWARRIARNIVRRRQTAPLRTTGDLVRAVEQSVPGPRGRIHPATRTFQALRIRVNEEMDNLKAFLDGAGPSPLQGPVVHHFLSFPGRPYRKESFPPVDPGREGRRKTVCPSHSQAGGPCGGRGLPQSPGPQRQTESRGKELNRGGNRG